MSKVMQYVIDAKQRILKTNKVCRGMYVNAACMNTRYTKTKANETVNNFFHLSQFSVWRELTLGNNMSKTIRCWNHNSQG